MDSLRCAKAGAERETWIRLAPCTRGSLTTGFSSLLSQIVAFWVQWVNFLFWCRGRDSNSHVFWTPAPKAGASTSSATTTRHFGGQVYQFRRLGL